MLVCYRDDFYWIQLWYVWSRRLMNGLGGTSILHLPGSGFVGQASPLFLAIEHGKCKLVSTRMHRTRSTHGARLWRLTCVWELSKASRRMLSGSGLALDGSRSAGGGEETLALVEDPTALTDANRTTLT